MSSIATFYLLPDSQRAEFDEARRTEKTITYKRTLFGKKEVITGERYLWEYLDAAAPAKTEFPFSGFVFIDYLFTFVAASAPEDVEAAMRSAAISDHYHVISPSVAATLAAHLQSPPPDADALAEFATEQSPGDIPEYVDALGKAHDFILQWFARVTPGHFGVLHLTF